jgi:hypothetical protein
MTRSRLLFAVLVAGLMAVPACGGASDQFGGASSNKGKTALSLVAYSTPQVVYDDRATTRRTCRRRSAGSASSSSTTRRSST